MAHIDVMGSGYTDPPEEQPVTESQLARRRNANTIRVARIENGYLVTTQGDGKTWSEDDRLGVFTRLDEFFNHVEGVKVGARDTMAAVRQDREHYHGPPIIVPTDDVNALDEAVTYEHLGRVVRALFRRSPGYGAERNTQVAQAALERVIQDLSTSAEDKKEEN